MGTKPPSSIEVPSDSANDNNKNKVAIVAESLYPSDTREEMTKRLSPELQALLAGAKNDEE
jgi:hypothetical protein